MKPCVTIWHGEHRSVFTVCDSETENVIACPPTFVEATRLCRSITRGLCRVKRRARIARKAGKP